MLWIELFVPQKYIFWDLMSNVTLGDGIFKKQLHHKSRSFIAEISALIKRTQRNLLHFPWDEDIPRRCLLHLIKQSFTINLTEYARNLIFDHPVSNTLKNKVLMFTRHLVFYHGCPDGWERHDVTELLCDTIWRYFIFEAYYLSNLQSLSSCLKMER